MQAVGEAAAFLRSYGISEVTGDRYSIGFVVSLFAEHQITYHENIRVKGPGSFSLAFEMAPEKALRLAGDITKMVRMTPASAARANAMTNRVERRGA